MEPARDSPADAPAAVPLSTTLARIAASEAALSALTGGASAADVLAELARLAAAELAQHFEQLPNPAMDGALRRAPGWRGWLQRPPAVRHRVVLVRYTAADPTWASSVGPSLISIDVTGHVLALGDDGTLRVGPFEETLLLDVGTEVPVEPLPSTDPRTRRVPTDRVRLTPWTGTNAPEQVAPPEAVLEALRASAGQLQAQLDGQAAMLRRLLAPT